MCRVCVCVGLGGRASELQRTSGGHRIKCALRNRSLCLLQQQQQQQQHGGKVRACLLHACLLLLWQQAGGSGTARISTRPPLTAASQQDTPIHTHNTTQHRPNRAWRGAFEWRCAPVVCPRHDYYHYMWPVIGTSEALLEREPNAHTHTHAYTRTARVVWWWWWCESVQATRTKTMYREREYRQTDIDRCLSVCDVEHIYIYIYVKQQQTNANTLVCVAGWLVGLVVALLVHGYRGHPHQTERASNTH